MAQRISGQSITPGGKNRVILYRRPAFVFSWAIGERPSPGAATRVRAPALESR